MKICTKCLNSFDLRFFNKRKDAKDGLTFWCKRCISANTLQWQKKNPELANLKSKRWISNNEEAAEISRINYKKNNPDKVAASNKQWNLNNPGKNRNSVVEWIRLNPGKVNYYAAKYNASKLKATPTWLSQEQLKEIEEFYILTQELQWLSDSTDPLEVDHIIPLQGKEVCGLHVPWNLQILPRSLNRKKSNNYAL